MCLHVYGTGQLQPEHGVLDSFYTGASALHTVNANSSYNLHNVAKHPLHAHMHVHRYALIHDCAHHCLQMVQRLRRVLLGQPRSK
jgi:hypothetical protein